ncbi:helix-turn-helix transcriptional regulator [Streptomyces sp. HUAS ZL42]|uniref:helix-turn-helix transcriptional regulator n=1 Tax=Streptomyces sp. HUAS ZL42 TaxID=3231715 RepID=UPI00345ED1D2
MPRGTADFDGDTLRFIRLTHPVGGRLLSAEALAKRLGTSKSRVLAYESNTSKPDPKRIAQISELFNVPVHKLRQKRVLADIQGLRCQAGLTVAQAAELTGISRSSYTNIERHALLPVRDDGTVRMSLARTFGVNPAVIDRSLQRHPAALARQNQLTALLDRLFQRAHLEHTPAVIDADEPLLQHIAKLLQRSPQVTCRLVNAELETFRDLLRERARTEVDERFAQTTLAMTQAINRRKSLEQFIEQAAPKSAKDLSRFLSTAMNVRQWRLMVALTNAGLEGIALSNITRYAPSADLTILQIRQYATVFQRGDQSYAAPTEDGLTTVLRNYPRYGRLYPRVAAPNMSRHRDPYRQYRISRPVPRPPHEESI